MDLEALFSPAVLRVLLLAVLVAPLGFAGLLALTGEQFRPARRLAGLLAMLHLALTIYLVAVAALYIREQSARHGGEGFHPIAVPGDTGAATKITGGSQEHLTTWNLFTVGRPDPTLPKVQPSVQFFIGLDGLNVWLVLLTSLMTYVSVAVSWNSAKAKAGGYYAWVFVLQSAVTGAFLSFDVILFYAFFELTLIPTFFLIGGWGVGGGKRDAARKFFLYTLLGSLFSLVGIIGIVYTNPVLPLKSADVYNPQVAFPHGTVTFDVNQLMLSVQTRQDAFGERIQKANAKVEAESRELEAQRKKSAADLAPYQKKLDDARSVAQAVSNERNAHSATQVWLFFALVAGFVVKVPLVPFHTWLPAAYGEAPTAVTLLLSALLAKLGTLGLLRIVIPLCPESAAYYGLPVFGTLGAIGVIYAAFCAFTQKDVKLMTAYSSVSHLGLLVMGMFALNAEGLSGANLHMVNHGLSAGAMFAVLAVIYDRYRTTDMTQLGGLWKKYPKWAFAVIFISLASVGLPGLSNFISEMMLIAGVFKPWATSTVGYWLAVAGCLGILLSAWYTFTMLKKVLFGPVKEPSMVPDGVVAGDLSGREFWALLLPCAGCLVLGIFPQLLTSVSAYDVGVVEEAVYRARLRVDPTLAEQEKPLPPPVKVMDTPDMVGVVRGAGGAPPGPPPIPPPPGGFQGGGGRQGGGRPGGGGPPR